MFVEPYSKLKEIFDDENKALLYLIKNNYVNEYKICDKCNKETNLNLNKKLYICKYYKCRKSINYIFCTIFLVKYQVHLYHLY